MLTLKAHEEGSRSSEAMLVCHLLLSRVKTLSTLERQVQLISYRDEQKASKVNKLAHCVIVIE